MTHFGDDLDVSNDPLLSHEKNRPRQSHGPICQQSGRLPKISLFIIRGVLNILSFLKPFQKVVQLIIGYLHLLMSIAWFGSILYVHILLKPAYAAKGLPKEELILGWLGIIILSITGVLLTITRMLTWEAFYTTRFGILLSLKIILFSIMVCTAIAVTFIIGPMMRRQRSLPLSQDKSRLTPDELSHFDGKGERPAYFAYMGKVYDATKSNLWKEGSHMKKHPAGNDLTDLLKTAPHREEKGFQMRLVGELSRGGHKNGKIQA